jgi:pimeloyl-ACP methyl ester carboxylesterase
MEIMPRGEMRVVKDAGHQPWLDEGPGIAHEVNAFLARG